jgi:hypothetical protein
MMNIKALEPQHTVHVPDLMDEDIAGGGTGRTSSYFA